MSVLRTLLVCLFLAFCASALAQDSTLDPVERALEAMRDNQANSPERNAELDRLLKQTRELQSRSVLAGGERITNFDTDIEVLTSGDIIITETIDLVATGREIKRGIFRELPLFYDFMGVKQRYNYKLLEITRDGQPENYTRMGNGNAVVWRIGRGDIILDPGPYQYRLRYSVADAVIRFEDHDELYWNTTGTYWEFPIERATATVRWPNGTQIREMASFSGGFGATISDAVALRNGTTATFKTSTPLPRKAGLTVAVLVEKGVIAPWSDERLRQLAWIRNGATIMLGLGGLGLLGYYFMMWTRVGRDPQKPPVFARYEPPEGYSPAAVHYIHHRTHRGMTALSAQLLHMGALGLVKITANKDVTQIDKLRDATDSDSKALFENLLPYNSERIMMDGETDSQLYRGVTAYLRKIAATYSRDYYRRNLGLAFLGMAGSLALVVFVLNSGVSLSGPIVLALMIGLVGLNLLFLKLLPAPTNKGSQISAQIDGFKLYLETAEKGRINTGGPLKDRPPAMSVELYERFLPYAVALGVEKPWTRHFETVMPQEAREYRPSYGRGSRFMRTRSQRTPISFGKTMTKALTSGVAAAAPVQRSSGSGSSGGWSSGGGGGGFSGGGGGGGGGGGW